jgi:hypothetical protein
MSLKLKEKLGLISVNSIETFFNPFSRNFVTVGAHIGLKTNLFLLTEFAITLIISDN